MEIFVIIPRMIFAENDHCGTVGQLFRTYLCQDKLHLCIKSPPGLLARVVLQLRHSEVTRIVYMKVGLLDTKRLLTG